MPSELTYDCHAPPETPFDIAIGPLASEPGCPPGESSLTYPISLLTTVCVVLSLRTIKSDVVVGIPKEDGERLDRDEPGWKISGKYAVVLLSPGHKGEEVVL